MTGSDESEATRMQQAALATTRQQVAAEVDELVDRFKPAVVKQRMVAGLRRRLSSLAVYALRRPALTVAAAGVVLVAWRLARRAT
jgi:hypothetical protein